MPAYSGGNRWVGVVALGEPPSPPTLMQLARRSDLARARREVEARSSRVDESEVGDPPLSLKTWTEALAMSMTPEEVREFEEVKKRLDEIILQVDRASRERTLADREIRKAKNSGDEQGRRAAMSLKTRAEAEYRSGRKETASLLIRLEQLVAKAVLALGIP